MFEHPEGEIEYEGKNMALYSHDMKHFVPFDYIYNPIEQMLEGGIQQEDIEIFVEIITNWVNKNLSTPEEQLNEWQRTQTYHIPYFDKDMTAEQLLDKVDKLALDLDLPTNLFNGYFTALEQGRCVLALTPLDPDEQGNWQLPEQIRLIRSEFTERPVLDDNTGELVGVRIIGVRSQIRDNIIPAECMLYLMHGFNNELFSDYYLNLSKIQNK